MYYLARQQRHLVGTQMQVAQQILIHLLGLHGPQGIVLVAFALMDENTLDDSLVLSTQGAVEQAYVRDVGIGMHRVLKPGGPPRASKFGRVVLLEEMLDAAATHSHVDDAHADVLGQALDECAAKVVARTQPRVPVVERWSGCVPLVLLACSTSVVACIGRLRYRRHHLEALAYSLIVAVLGLGIAHHIGLPEGEEYVEGGVGLTIELVVLHRVSGRARCQEDVPLRLRCGAEQDEQQRI